MPTPDASTEADGATDAPILDVDASFDASTTPADGAPPDALSPLPDASFPGPLVLQAWKFGGTGEDSAMSIAVDGSGNVLVSGIFQGSVSFGGPPLVGETGSAVDAFAVKFNSAMAHQWSRKIGAPGGSESGRGIAASTGGNAAVVGECSLAVDLGSGTPTCQGGGTYLAQYASANGAHQFSRGFPAGTSNSGTAASRRVAVDTSGNVVVVDVFCGPQDFGGGLVTPPSSSCPASVAKYSSTGQLVWLRTFGETGSNVRAYGVAFDSSGNVYVHGDFAGNANFGAGVVSSATGNDFVLKRDAAGNHVWARTFNLGGFYTRGIAVDASGNAVIVGQFSVATANFGNGVTISVSGDSDGYVAKLGAASGTAMWAKALGGPSADLANSVVVDAAGDVVVSGLFNGSANFGGGMVTSSGQDIFVLKLRADGSFAWALPLGGPTDNIYGALALDAAGDIWITGQFSGNVMFGSTLLNSAGGNDIFVAKLAR